MLTGQAAAQYAGPAIVLSFVLAGSGCAFAGLCYAEFASMIPIAGSAYTYGYATLGEIFAWIIGWDLILEYAFGAATVASGWSSTLVAFLQDYGINIPPQICDVPGAKWSMVDGRWAPDSTFSIGPDDARDPAHHNRLQPHGVPRHHRRHHHPGHRHQGIGELQHGHRLREADRGDRLHHRRRHVCDQASRRRARELAPFPAQEHGSFGAFGWSGVLRGAGVIFFAYIGFDAVSTAAQEAHKPQKDMPIGILGSLVICTMLYILVSGLLTATVHYSRLNIGAPVSLAIRETGVRWGSYVVNAGALAGLSTVMLVMLLGQSRVFYSMAHDGLLWKWAGDIHPKFRTPWKSTAVTGILVAFTGSLVPIGDLGQLVSIGTLMAFVIVCAGVWVMRRNRPEVHRPFRTPWMPFVPIMGIIISLALMLGLNGVTWIRLFVWLIIGMVIYFTYGRHHSLVQKMADEEVKVAGN